MTLHRCVWNYLFINGNLKVNCAMKDFTLSIYTGGMPKSHTHVMWRFGGDFEYMCTWICFFIQPLCHSFGCGHVIGLLRDWTSDLVVVGSIRPADDTRHIAAFNAILTFDVSYLPICLLSCAIFIMVYDYDATLGSIKHTALFLTQFNFNPSTGK